jgi:2-polyprenyl-3-methyl-5-hydroxy-6-metoxy-1,4-benzoquinol methylase
MDTPPNWFENVYADSDTTGAGVPWARMEPSAELVAWLDREQVRGDGLRALVVGCGLGDDAQELDRRGFQVTAFDVSDTAIALCHERFPGLTVTPRASIL